MRKVCAGREIPLHGVRSPDLRLGRVELVASASAQVAEKGAVERSRDGGVCCSRILASRCAVAGVGGERDIL